MLLFVLVGLQSFAEGLDLKGDYLTQVHIHKIAFPPIDSPVVITEGEWLKSLNRYPFEVQSLPAASFNLIQQTLTVVFRQQATVINDDFTPSSSPTCRKSKSVRLASLPRLKKVRVPVGVVPQVNKNLSANASSGLYC